MWFSPAHQCELKLQSSELSRISSVIRLNSSSLFTLPLQRFLGLIQSNGYLSWSHTVSSASYKKHEIIYQKIQNTEPALPSICHVSGQSTNVWAQYEWINTHRTPSCVTGGKSVHCDTCCLHILVYSILPRTLWGRHIYYELYLTEWYRAFRSHPEWHSKWVVAPGLNLVTWMWGPCSWPPDYLIFLVGDGIQRYSKAPKK